MKRLLLLFTWCGRDFRKRIAISSILVPLLMLFGSSCAFPQQANITELTLEEAISQASVNNASVQRAKLETRRSSEELAATRTRRYPSMSVLALGSELLTKPSITFDRGAFGTFSGVGPIPGTDTKIEVPQRPVGVVNASITVPLTTQYKIHLQLEGLAAALAATLQEENAQLLETVNHVRQAYYAIVEAQSKLDSLQASLPLYEESKRLANENFSRETILESQLLGANVQLLQTQDSISQASDQLAASEEKLNDLMGRDIHTQFRVSGVADADEASPPLEALEAQALASNPNLKKAHLQVKQSDFDRRAKKAEYIPEISLSLNYLTTANFGSTLPSNISAAGFQLNWEPWDWGRRRHEFSEKTAQEEEAKLAVAATERSVLLDVRNAWRQVEDSRRQVLLGAANQVATRQKLKEIQEQVKNEKKLTKDLYSGQSELASADSQYQQALSAFWKARADLKKVTGER